MSAESNEIIEYQLDLSKLLRQFSNRKQFMFPPNSGMMIKFAPSNVRYFYVVNNVKKEITMDSDFNEVRSAIKSNNIKFIELTYDETNKMYVFTDLDNGDIVGNCEIPHLIHDLTNYPTNSNAIDDNNINDITNNRIIKINKEKKRINDIIDFLLINENIYSNINIEKNKHSKREILPSFTKKEKGNHSISIYNTGDLERKKKELVENGITIESLIDSAKAGQYEKEINNKHRILLGIKNMKSYSNYLDTCLEILMDTSKILTTDDYYFTDTIDNSVIEIDNSNRSNYLKQDQLGKFEKAYLVRSTNITAYNKIRNITHIEKCESIIIAKSKKGGKWNSFYTSEDIMDIDSQNKYVQLSEIQRNVEWGKIYDDLEKMYKNKKKMKK